MLACMHTYIHTYIHTHTCKVTCETHTLPIHVSFLFTVVTGCYVTPTSPLTLSCTAVQKVYIMKVRLGRSACLVINECCPNNTDCVIQPTKHIQYLKKRCDGRHTCIIDMISAWCKGPTDYESVHYVCRSINPGELTLY